MSTNVLKWINWMATEIAAIRKQLATMKPETTPFSVEWIAWKEAMAFFEYKDTQMAEMATEQDLIVAKVGRRKFIKRASIQALLEKNILTYVKRQENSINSPKTNDHGK